MIKATYHMICAQQLASREKYEDALAHLELMHPKNLFKFEPALLRGFLLLVTNRPEVAKSIFEELRDRMSTLTRYSEADIAHFEAYLRNHIRNAVEIMGQDKSRYPEPDYAKVPVNAVTTAIKLNYPLPEHPDWNGA
ncbi:MAG: hypothetical protein JJ900_16865 [Rhodospirillales bacterium]|nr:hypothetical protein [Rhodospirillales bacterium]MBO6788521.1 hypothetical protein [Rhodospirillales bacterium]